MLAKRLHFASEIIIVDNLGEKVSVFLLFWLQGRVSNKAVTKRLILKPATF